VVDHSLYHPLLGWTCSVLNVSPCFTLTGCSHLVLNLSPFLPLQGCSHQVLNLIYITIGRGGGLIWW